MGEVGASVASRHYARVVTLAGACVLAAGLVIAPPAPSVVRTELPRVQLAALSQPLQATVTGLLQRFVSNRARTGGTAYFPVPSGATEVTTALLTPQGAAKSVSAPAGSGQQVNDAAAVAVEAYDASPLLNLLVLFSPLVGTLIVAGIIVNLLNPAEWIYLPYRLLGIVGFVFGIPFPVIGPFAATAATAVPELTIAPSSSEQTPVTPAKAPEVDVTHAADSKKGDAAESVTPAETKTSTDQAKSPETVTETEEASPDTSTKDATETAATDEAVTEPEPNSEENATDTELSTNDAIKTAGADEDSPGQTVVKSPEPSASASSPDQTKHSASTRAGDDGSSSAASSSSGGKLSAGNSSGGDADGS